MIQFPHELSQHKLFSRYSLKSTSTYLKLLFTQQLGMGRHIDSQVNPLLPELITTPHDSCSNFQQAFQSTMKLHAGHSSQHDAISYTYEDPISSPS